MRENLFYSCGCSGDERGGVYLCRETESGRIETVSFTALKGTNYLCFSGDRKFLYATWNEDSTGGAAAFTADPDGMLRRLNEFESEGSAACHVTLSPDGAFLYTANYSSGNFAEFRIAEDGSLARRARVFSHLEHSPGPRKDRQEHAHPHCVRFTPDGAFLCVVDLGIDAVFFYPFRPGAGISSFPLIRKMEPGSGPRHILFPEHQPGIAYLINELSNSVCACRFEPGGELTVFQTVSTLPENCSAVTKASAIRVSPGGRFLYASNRGYDSIACFRVGAGGKLEFSGTVPAHGSSPRDVNFLPSGRIFAVSNEFSDRICCYSFDAKTGALVYLAGRDVTDEVRPLCIEY